MTPENCPSCGKELAGIRDYPRLEIQSVKLQPIPDEVLHWRSRIGVHPLTKVDITEEIKEVVSSPPVQQYLNSLNQSAGQEVEADEILPHFEQGRFPWSFAIPNSNYYLSLGSEKGNERVALVSLWGDGPNMGSAGGPTLQRYINLASIEFQGKLLEVSKE